MNVKITAIALLLALSGCSKDRPEPISGGEPKQGAKLLAAYGCASCQQIAGIAHSDSTVGPSLKELSMRSHVAGVLPNSAGNLEKWIMHPHQFSRNTAMPELGVSESEARHMAAYLYRQ